ncbi:MAG: glyoxalase superfamily protein [Pseudomonadota bacterium]
MTAGPRLTSSIPVLRVADYPRARAFWSGKLGFRVVEEGGDPPRFGIFALDAAEVFLNGWDGPDPTPGAGWRAYFYTDDVEGLAAALVAKGVSLDNGPETMSYGLREIEVIDSEGNRLCFGQVLDAAPPAS